MDRISAAIDKLYGGWGNIPESSRTFIEAAFRTQDYAKLYADSIAIDFAEDYPGVLGEANVNDILASLKQRSSAPIHSQSDQQKKSVSKKKKAGQER